MNIDLAAATPWLLAIFGLFSALMGWLGRELWSAVQKLRLDLSALELRISTDYVRYDRLQDVMKPVMEALHEIRDKLDRKQDRV